MKSIFAGATIALLGACTLPGQHYSAQSWVNEPVPQTEPLQYDLRRLSPDVIAAQQTDNPTVAGNPDLDRALRDYEYRVGPRDILIFTVWDHPELTIPAGAFRAPEIQGHLVSPEGEIFFPYVGTIDVGGKTLGEIRELLTDRLGRYIQDPQLDARIAAFRSQRINVSGQVATPGFYPVTDTPITLVDALNLAGGTTDDAAMQSVRLVRDGQTHIYDLVRLLHRGDLRENMLLRDGDVVFVPRNDFFVAHVLGSVSKPGAVPLVEGRLNLAQALSSTGGLRAAEANAGKIFVFRYHRDGRPEVYWLDARSADAMMLATRFALEPQDVVFVASTPLARWNRLVGLVLPTIQSLWQSQNFIDDIEN